MNKNILSAAALSYENTDDAPVITARGKNESAALIVEIARRYGIPVIEDPSLASALAKLDEDTEIPNSFFRAVAIIFNELEESATRLCGRGRVL